MIWDDLFLGFSRCVPPFLLSSTLKLNWHPTFGPGRAALEKASAARVSADSICSCKCEICSKCRSACGSKFKLCVTICSMAISRTDSLEVPTIYIYIYICIYIYIYLFTHTHTHTYIYIYIIWPKAYVRKYPQKIWPFFTVFQALYLPRHVASSLLRCCTSCRSSCSHCWRKARAGSKESWNWGAWSCKMDCLENPNRKSWLITYGYKLLQTIKCKGFRQILPSLWVCHWYSHWLGFVLNCA